MRQDKMACNQVTALLSYYIDGKVSAQITYFIEQHLKRCKTCRTRYEVLLKAVTDIRDVKTQIENLEFNKCVPVSANSITFNEKMSAYLDNELTDEESLRFRRYAIANPPVRNELEEMFKVKNAMNTSFEHTKNDFKEDFTKNVMDEVKMEELIYEHEPLILKVLAIFIFLFVFLSVSAIVIF